jgi:tRNA A-37 threonylcarbamoyl transferase component Bud32
VPSPFHAPIIAWIGRVVTVSPAASEPRVVPGRHRRPSGEPPPLPRELNRAAVGWLVAFVFWAAIWIWIFLRDEPALWITERDLELMDPIVARRQEWLTPAMQHINEVGTFWLTPIVGWITIAGGLAAKRIRHVLLLVASLSLVALIQTLVSLEILRPRPLGVEQIGYWSGAAQPSRPVALLMTALMCAGLTLVPAARRRAWYWATGVIIAVFGAAQIYTGVDHPSDVLPSITLGVAAPLVLYRLAAPEQVFPIAYRTGKTAHLDVTGSRGEAIKVALRNQLGIEVTSVERIGLSGSAGSTPLRITQADGPDLFAKLYASTHLRSDRSYKLGRTLLYGRLEDEQHFNSVRRLIQHEDYMLHLMQHAGIDSMAPIGIVEITPDREYLMVSEFLEGAVEIGDAEVTTEVIDSGLRTVARLWDAGLAHRDIKPANIMVQGDRVRLIDLSFAEVRPSPWRQAVDLANMMLVLALRSSPERVYERALLQFDEDDIAEAFAASRGVTLPSALRADVKRDGRELLVRFRQLAPERPPVAIQRWSVRRVGLTIWMVLVSLILISIFVDNLGDIALR